MSFNNFIFTWLNLISLIEVFEGIFIILGKYTPIYVKKKLKGKPLKSWRKIRFLKCIILAIAFYSFTFSKNINLNVNIKLLINITGLILIFIGEFISIRNNIKYIGKWNS